MPPIYDVTDHLTTRPWAEDSRRTKEMLLDCVAHNLAQNDIAVLFKFDQTVVVERLEAIIKTACGSSVTFDVGMYSDAGTTTADLDSLLDGMDGNAAAGTYASSLTVSGDPGAQVASGAGIYLAGTTAAPKYICAKILGAASALGKVLFRVHYSNVHMP